MQAITPDLNVSAPPNLAQPSAIAKPLSTQQSDFKKTLQDTDDKPVRKSGKHLPDPGNELPVVPVPVTTTAIPGTNLGVAGPAANALNPPVDDAAKLAGMGAVALPMPAPVAAPVPGVSDAAGDITDAGQSVVAGTAAAPIGANSETQASYASLVDSSSSGAVTGKGTSPANAPVSPSAQTAPKSRTPNLASMNSKARGNEAAGAASTAANAVGANAATGDPDSSGAAQTTDADATLQTMLAANMSAAATAVAAPAASSAPSAATVATPATGAEPSAAVNTAAPVAMDIAQPATAAVAASVAQIVIGAAESSAAEKHSHAPTTDKASTLVGTEGAAGFAQLVTNSSSADAAPANLKVAAGVDSPGFAQGVGNQVQVMVDNNLNTAKLQVNPSSLGPIEVRIAIQNGHAQVWMTSHSAVTRDALESSTPQLKEMLGSQGFSQVSVDISQRSFQERTPQPQSYDWQPLSGDERAAPIQSVTASAARGGSGVVDAYA